MNEIESRVEHLRRVLAAKQDGYLFVVESCLAGIIELNCPHDIEALLGLLDDSAEDDVMFLIVHTIERWDDETYARALLRKADSVWETAPRWARILHVRVMNAPNTNEAYMRLLDSAPRNTRNTVLRICESIVQEWPDLAAKLAPLLDRLAK